MPSEGERAPDFSLAGPGGNVRLRDVLARGPVLLAFYFEDATPSCSVEVASLKDIYEPVRELGADVIAVSADSVASHRAFAERLGGVPFALLSDEGLEAARAYDVVSEEDTKRARRALFVIDREGTVRYAANPYSPNSLAQLEGALRALGMDL